MRTLQEIEKDYSDTTKKLREEYKNAMLEILKESGLNDGVIRKKDGVKGVIQIYCEYASFFPKYHFHPYTKNGEISKVQKGWIWDDVTLKKDYAPDSKL